MTWRTTCTLSLYGAITSDELEQIEDCIGPSSDEAGSGTYTFIEVRDGDMGASNDLVAIASVLEDLDVAYQWHVQPEMGIPESILCRFKGGNTHTVGCCDGEISVSLWSLDRDPDAIDKAQQVRAMESDPFRISTSLELSPSELNTILAALRLYQNQSTVPRAINEIATNGGTQEPLGLDEIDELCERINVS